MSFDYRQVQLLGLELHDDGRQPGDSIGRYRVDRLQYGAQLVGHVLVGDGRALNVVLGDGNESAHVVGADSGVVVSLYGGFEDHLPER